MAKEHDFRGPGVVKPHPRKNWVNPDAKQVAYASGAKAKRSSGPSRPTGPSRPSEPSAPREPSEPSEPRRARSGRSPVQLFAALMGLVFLLAGIGGFIPGVTKPYDDLKSYGTDSTAELLGLFRVSYLHNAVHLLFAVGLLAAASRAASKLYLIGGGVAYLGVAAYGYIVDQDSEANFLPINDTDNLLHVGLSLGMIVLGLVGIAAEKRR